MSPKPITVWTGFSARQSGASPLVTCWKRFWWLMARSPETSAKLDTLTDSLRLFVEPVTPEQILIARVAFRRFGKGSGHPARLNFGDCFAYALARALDEPLLFVGYDFAHTDIRRVS